MNFELSCAKTEGRKSHSFPPHSLFPLPYFLLNWVRVKTSTPLPLPPLPLLLLLLLLLFLSSSSTTSINQPTYRIHNDLLFYFLNHLYLSLALSPMTMGPPSAVDGNAPNGNGVPEPLTISGVPAR